VETFRIGSLTLAPPLGAAYIAAALEAAGERVHVIDAVGQAPSQYTNYFGGHLIGMRLEEIVERIPPSTEFVGISCIFTFEWPMVVHLTRLIRRSRPDLPIIIGGEHVTSMPEFSLATSEADILVLGEGEETAVALVRALRARQPLDDVAGIAFRRGSELVMNRRRARMASIDQVARPAWRHFDLRAYHEQRLVGGVYSTRLTVPILATRGCPYQCTFCSSPNMWTTRWVARDPVDVVDEIQSYVQDYGAGNFPFQDLTAVLRRDWIIRFCQEIIDRGLDITWQLANGTRSEAIDREVALLLKRSGMISAAYAPESGSETTRAYIKKRVKSERLLESVRCAAEADLNICAYMIVGFPHDKPEHLRESLSFLRDIARAGVRDMGTAYYMALPGTELFRSLCETGRIVIDRNYFRQVLEGVSPFPATTYCDALSRTDLFLWKLRFIRAFYGQRLEQAGLRKAVTAALRTLGEGDHETKLETALRMALRNAAASIKVLFGPRWMSRAEEQKLFDGWDDIFRRILAERRQCGVEPKAPTDFTELERRDMIPLTRLDHDRRRTLTVSEVTAPPPG
jgi:radical SAM superfamily enzyme YgiQ (UPF0313 family)